eukprot:957121-Pyramimonas_sp.AAC.1
MAQPKALGGICRQLVTTWCGRSCATCDTPYCSDAGAPSAAGRLRGQIRQSVVGGMCRKTCRNLRRIPCRAVPHPCAHC